MVKNHILCMACFSIEDSRGDDRRAKFSLVYEIRDTEMTSLPSPRSARAIVCHRRYLPESV